MMWLIGLAALLEGIWCWFLLRGKLAKKLSDIPNERSSHSSPAVRGGGLPFSLFFIAGLLAVAPWGAFPETSVILVSCAVLMIGIVGFADDRYSISASFRLIIQIIAATLAAYAIGLFAEPSGGLNYAAGLWILYAVLTINLFNFADGINGYIALSGIIAGLYFYLTPPFPAGTLQNPTAALFPLMASLAVFAAFNIWTRRIFMGDSGSTVIGMVYALFVGILFFKPLTESVVPTVNIYQGIESLALGSAAAAVVFVDGLAMLFAKIIARYPLTQPHRLHLYQRMSQVRWLSHIGTTVVLCSLQAALAGFVLDSMNTHGPHITGMISVIVLLVLCVVITAIHVRELRYREAERRAH